MILTIDVGNTSTGFAQFEGEKITKKWTVETKKLKESKFPPSKKFSKVVVSSVVPMANNIIKRQYKKAFFVEAKKVKGLKIKIKKISEVGADRAVNAFYAIKAYTKPCIVIDFGTATTFDVISKKGEYLGGAISAGIKMTLDVLFEKTAKLPKIKLAPPKNLIGNTTVEAIRSGILYGYGSMVDGMIKKFKKELGEGASVVATGGYADLISKYAREIDIIDKELTLKGLNYICQKN